MHGEIKKSLTVANSRILEIFLQSHW